MRRSFLAVSIVATAACVDVPDGIRAEFAAAGPADRSNYRPGRHGSALPVEPVHGAPSQARSVEDSPAPKAAAVTGPTPESDADGGAAKSAERPADGGAP